MEENGGLLRQTFVVTIDWSPDAAARVTEGDIREAIEELALDLDEDATVEAAETVEGAGAED